jgi:hypothetical protein
VVRAVAYICGVSLYDERDGQTYFRRVKDDVVATGRYGPDISRNELWNLAKRAELRRNSVEGRHVIIALPREVSDEARYGIVRALGEHIFNALHTPVEFAIHDNALRPNEPHNPHAHLIFAAREWSFNQPVGFGRKTRQLDVPIDGGPIIEALRKRYEELVNASLPINVKKVSRRSHKDLGNGRTPRRHFGPAAWWRMKKGLPTVAGALNGLIDEQDKLRLQIAALEEQRCEVEESESALDLVDPALAQDLRERRSRTAEYNDLAPIKIETLRRAVVATTHAELAITGDAPAQTAEAKMAALRDPITLTVDPAPKPLRQITSVDAVKPLEVRLPPREVATQLSDGDGVLDEPTPALSGGGLGKPNKGTMVADPRHLEQRDLI